MVVLVVTSGLFSYSSGTQICHVGGTSFLLVASCDTPRVAASDSNTFRLSGRGARSVTESLDQRFSTFIVLRPF
jgi:hypothetical protein